MKQYAFFYFKPSNTQILRGANFASALKVKGVNVEEYYFYSKRLFEIRVWSINRKITFLKWIAEWIQVIYTKVSIAFLLKRAIKKSSWIHLPKRIDLNSLMVIKKQKGSNKKVLYDFDDAIWMDSFNESKYLKEICNVADIVTCDNDFLANYLDLNFQTKCHIIPPYFNQIGYFKKRQKSDGFLRMGWIGSESTFAFIESIRDPLQIILSNYPNVKLCLAGVSLSAIQNYFSLYSDQIEVVPRYNAKEMFKFLNKLDIGLFPCFNDDNSKGRGFLKVILYKSVGLPVISSYNDYVFSIIKDEIDGFVAKTNNQWVIHLSNLIENDQTRKSVGDSAFVDVSMSHSLESNADEIIQLINAL